MAEVHPLQPRSGRQDISIKGWRGFVTRRLADRMGVLAEIVVAEALDECGIDENRISLGNINRFLAALYYRLPDEVNRRDVILGLQSDIVRRLFGSLSRDLKSRIDESREPSSR